MSGVLRGRSGTFMTLARRRFLQFAAGAIALPATARLARAQAFPSRPVTLIVPYLGGGPADGLARPLAARMSVALGQPVVIENVPGQSGAIGVARAIKAAPDGYTLSYGHNGSHVVNGAVYTLPFDLRSDLEAIALLPSNPLSISARKDFPPADLKELIAWLKANPGQARVGNVGPASGTNINAVYFESQTGTRFQMVPHQSVQTGMKALVAGELDLMFDQASHSLPFLRAGAIKSYAITSKTRTASLPDIPTTDEAGLPGFHSANWYGLWAPKGTPKDIVARLNGAVVEALADATVVKQLADQGLDMPPADQRTPEALAAFHRSEIEKWWPLIQKAGIKAK